MGCGASAPAGSRAAKKVGHVNPATAMKEIQREFEGTDVWGFEKSNTSRESTIEGSDGLWSLNERALAQKHSFEWLQKRKKVEQFMLSMKGYGVPFLTVVACIQLFQEGAGWPHQTPSLSEILFVKCVFATAVLHSVWPLTASSPLLQACLWLFKGVVLVSKNLPVL